MTNTKFAPCHIRTYDDSCQTWANIADKAFSSSARQLVRVSLVIVAYEVRGSIRSRFALTSNPSWQS
jgi:hypothetical protein